MHMLQNRVACIVYNRSKREGPWYEKNFRRAIGLNFLYFTKEQITRSSPILGNSHKYSCIKYTGVNIHTCTCNNHSKNKIFITINIHRTYSIDAGKACSEWTMNSLDLIQKQKILF